jgi:hypothetical protein
MSALFKEGKISSEPITLEFTVDYQGTCNATFKKTLILYKNTISGCRDIEIEDSELQVCT